MTGVRRLYIDDAPGERRGVVTLDGAPERLLIERDGDQAHERVGARFAARLKTLDRSLGLAFLDLGEGAQAAAALPSREAGLAEGALVEAAITTAPREGKAAAARILGKVEGEVRLIEPAPPLAVLLKGFAPGEAISGGSVAQAAADEAEEAALAIRHPLPGGGWLSIEPTRALVAIDVDVGAASGGDSRRLARRINGIAIAEAARLLRLNGLGGLVAIDLAGKGHDGAALSAIAKAAFAPDGPEVSIGPVSRFGVLELALPRGRAPVAERLLDPSGRPTLETLALRLFRAIERAAGPGLRVEAKAAPEVAAKAEALAPVLVQRIGARFVIVPDLARNPERPEVSAV